MGGETGERKKLHNMKETNTGTVRFCPKNIFNAVLLLSNILCPFTVFGEKQQHLRPELEPRTSQVASHHTLHNATETYISKDIQNCNSNLDDSTSALSTVTNQPINKTFVRNN
jgi:hypothetical protein